MRVAPTGRRPPDPVAPQGAEKTILSKMLVEGSNRRTYAIDRHAGIVSLLAWEMCSWQQQWQLAIKAALLTVQAPAGNCP